MLRLLTALSMFLVMSVAQAQTLPAWSLGPPLGCTERGGWVEDGHCLICPETQPERTDNSALGDRACTRPAGWIWVPLQDVPAVLSSRPKAGGPALQYRCPGGGILRGRSCAICPPLSLRVGSRCKDRVVQSWAAALHLDVTACPKGAWHGDDSLCYSCRGGLARADSSKQACLPDPTGVLRSGHQANYIDNPRRSAIEVKLGTFLAQGKATSPERTELMQNILLQEWKTGTPPYYDTLIWLKPDRDVHGQLSGGYVQLKRNNPHGWHCAGIYVVTRQSQPSAPLPQDTILMVASGNRIARPDEILAWLEPLPAAGISAGHSWKTRQGTGLIWEIGMPPVPDKNAAIAHYRFLGPFTIHPATDCAELLWP